MDNRAPGAAPPPPAEPRASFWNARRRRPVFLVLLAAGLILFLIRLPGGARASLATALRTHWELVLLLGLFALLTLSLIGSAGQRLDTRLFLLINLQAHPKWLDRFMGVATQLGNMLTALIAAFLLILWNNLGLAFEIILGTLTLWLVVETLKALTDRTRPFLDLEGTKVIGWREPGRSFPSGHTAQIFFLAALLSFRFSPGAWGIAALYAVAILVGFTRMYVGAHYPRDVIAGAVLGSVWGLLATLATPYWIGMRF
ncbi:MAG: phosphatase PAP2 family protein [Anaerolineales bacterium]|nr:phosphatase PAP2 family protein [Anaerolineales bacterium]